MLDIAENMIGFDGRFENLANIGEIVRAPSLNSSSRNDDLSL
jgi:hypothetical protein